MTDKPVEVKPKTNNSPEADGLKSSREAVYGQQARTSTGGEVNTVDTDILSGPTSNKTSLRATDGQLNLTPPKIANVGPEATPLVPPASAKATDSPAGRTIPSGNDTNAAP